MSKKDDTVVSLVKQSNQPETSLKNAESESESELKKTKSEPESLSKICEKAERLLERLDNFWDVVFCDMKKDEYICSWSDKTGRFGYPQTELIFKKQLTRHRGPVAYYFCSATMRLDKKGKLYNRQAQFMAFYLIIFDDVGTGLGSKIHPDKLPAELRNRPTYIIETSPGNYQYGYVFETPIRDLETAKIFQKIIIEKSGADRGGCMPNKIIRLPFGVNLKEKYREEGEPLFECQLIELNEENIWGYDELLLACEAEVTWEQVQAQAKGGAKQIRTLCAGTTPYRQHTPYLSTIDGIVDPVLDWMYAQGMIISEGPEWFTILCPWRDKHTDGKGLAGYSPLGVGSDPLSRWVNCFHDHCKHRETRDFLAYIHKLGGPRVGMSGVVEKYVARYGFDMDANMVIDMKSPEFKTIKHIGFKNQLATKIWVPNKKGVITGVSEFTLWNEDPNRMRFSGRRRVPGGPRIIPNSHGGYPALNTWYLPDWGEGDFDSKLVQPFLDFIHYLIPDKKDADWFLQHLASKAKDARYRGPGIIMSTPIEGTGRGTLERAIERVWGRPNTTNVTLSMLVSGAAAADNNSWMLKDWIFLPEAKETDMSAKKANTAYESLKRFIETGPSSIPIKEKWGVTYDEDCYGSVIICSQHRDAIPVDSGSTRFKRMENTHDKWSDDQFLEFHTWLETSGFEPHVWRWLLAQDLSGFNKFARQPELSVDDELEIMITSYRAVDSAVMLCLAYAEEHTYGVVFLSEMMAGLEGLEALLGLDDIRGWRRPVRRELRNKTQELVTANKKRWRPRYDDAKPSVVGTTLKKGMLLKYALAHKHPSEAQEALIEKVCAIDVSKIQDDYTAFCNAKVEELK